MRRNQSCFAATKQFPSPVGDNAPLGLGPRPTLDDDGEHAVESLSFKSRKSYQSPSITGMDILFRLVFDLQRMANNGTH